MERGERERGREGEREGERERGREGEREREEREIKTHFLVRLHREL